MDSINKNQQEQNKEDLVSAAAIEKIIELSKSQTCFFCTQSSSAESLGVRPMSVQKVDESGSLWFLCANDSYTHNDITAHPQVKLYFQGSKHSDFLYLEGDAQLSEDKARIKELWQPVLKAWFTEGENDPRICVIRVEPTSGYYWDNKHGNAIAAIKILVGAVTGITLDDSIEGKVKV